MVPLCWFPERLKPGRRGVFENHEYLVDPIPNNPTATSDFLLVVTHGNAFHSWQFGKGGENFYSRSGDPSAGFQISPRHIGFSTTFFCRNDVKEKDHGDGIRGFALKWYQEHQSVLPRY